MTPYLYSQYSLCTKQINEIFTYVSTHTVDIVCITELWLSNGIDDSLVKLPNFNTFRYDRHNSRGGGVLVYVKSDIKCSV